MNALTEKLTVDLPTVGTGASVEEVLRAIATRLDGTARVLQAEFNWMKPIIEFSREIDDQQIADGLKHGYIDEAAAVEKRGEDTPILIRAQVDTHLRNLEIAPKILLDIVAILNALKSVEPGSTPLSNGGLDNLSEAPASRATRACTCEGE